MAVGMKSVMVVDDDPDICMTMQIALESFGYCVITASDGAEALRKLETVEAPCLILLDLMMPGMNGQQFREAQLRNAALAEIPVVVLSGDYKVNERAAEMGVEGLGKPIELPLLLAKVEQFCGRST
jgi:CheY-like chemotaxis protein